MSVPRQWLDPRRSARPRERGLKPERGTGAAMIYQHATRDRDQAIARALGGLVREVRQDPPAESSRSQSEA
jgi:hypothetical protein